MIKELHLTAAFTPEAQRTHALLSPSGAVKWLNCTPSARLEDALPNNTSEYAEEGTLAHSICELYANLRFKGLKKAAFNKALKVFKANPLYNAEMLNHAENYAEKLAELSMMCKASPYMAFEVKVDLSDWVPDSFGTCDCIIIAGRDLMITDIKYGKGVLVSAKDNPQLMLYALGALKQYRPLYGDSIQSITLNVYQPRLDNYDSYTLTAEELLSWGEKVVKPKAHSAYTGFGKCVVGEWCDKGFCRMRATCRARAEHFGALADFMEIELPASENSAQRKEEQDGTLVSPTLTHEEIGQYLHLGAQLVKWYNGLEEYALAALLRGDDIPGWKAVHGRSTRKWNDQDAALMAIENSGIDRALIYDYVPKTLSQLEKTIGVKEFEQVASKFIIKPPGKPALAHESDKRPKVNSAVSDFAEVV